ncbi:MAG: protoheme farnesyltransferase [Proteobacteria bacterium]|nr:protoheme farnesyltransferase [Pseudomonadota bacterium]
MTMIAIQTLHAGVRRHWRDYLELTKPKVVALITFTAMVGMLLATPGRAPWEVLLFGSLGIALLAGSAAALNHLADRRIDAQMARTCRRPLPSGHLETGQVLGFALLIGALGLSLLLAFTNPLTAVLTVASVWTPPHFWSLAIHRYHDYAKADIPMLPVTHGVAFTRLQILLYTILLIPISLLPFLTGMSGWIYLVGALILGGRFLSYAIRLFVTGDDRLAMPTFGFSIVYLFGLFAALMLDHVSIRVATWTG